MLLGNGAGDCHRSCWSGTATSVPYGAGDSKPMIAEVRLFSVGRPGPCLPRACANVLRAGLWLCSSFRPAAACESLE